jgi:4-alpha-glucanotransferase
MTADPHLLQRLAGLVGLATSYVDAWSLRREVPAATLEALLAAMAIDTATSATAQASLALLDERSWRRLVEPVAVVDGGASDLAIDVTMPDELPGDAAIGWRVELEGGGSREGATLVAALPVVEERLLAEGRRVRRHLALPAGLPDGYHRVTVALGETAGTLALIVAPHTAYLPPEMTDGSDGRLWGLSSQLYALRSARNWGIGDFSDLADLARGSSTRGARAIGLNPLHALFPDEPRHISPYSPSSRCFVNPLYLAIEAIPDFEDCAAARNRVAEPAFQAHIAAARAAGLVDHVAVAAAKFEILERLYVSFRERHLGDDPGRPLTLRGEAFRRFQDEGGEALADFTLFEALHEYFSGHFAWTDWPEPFRDPRSDAVRAFAAEHAVRIGFFQYLQWEADRQLGDAARLAEAAGMSVGLYRDLAVGVDPFGAEAWGDQVLLMTGATLGAPPDVLNLSGQNWGLAAISPTALRERAYAPFIAALRANMRHAGALRIDHVMSLRQLYLIPRGASADAGTYVRYPFEDLLRIVALESQRNRCIVVGEDLGTVPEGFRERLVSANILSYRLLVFERRPDGSFLPPEAYPPLAAASVGTHDVATLKGFWLGRDLAWRDELDLYPDEQRRVADRDDRARQRRLLLDALIKQGVLPPHLSAELLPTDDSPIYRFELALAAHRYLGKSPARLMLVQLEDAMSEEEQVNLPGTIDEHPNWRRKLPLSVAELLGDACFTELTNALNEVRPASRPAQTSKAALSGTRLA